MPVEPTWDIELAHAAAFFASHPGAVRTTIIGLDEVGRGALAGPVMVGAFACTVDKQADASLAAQSLPPGIRDSKLLGVKKRESLAEILGAAPYVSSVGAASAQEIDEVGISAALTLASVRALHGVLELVETPLGAVILDGNVDYLSRGLDATLECPLDVRVKADQTCMSVGAASIVAKVRRDQHMIALGDLAPEYGWAKNKGYGAAQHREAIACHGVHPEHRTSWNLVPANPQPAFEGFLAG